MVSPVFCFFNVISVVPSLFVSAFLRISVDTRWFLVYGFQGDFGAWICKLRVESWRFREGRTNVNISPSFSFEFQQSRSTSTNF